MPEVMIEHDGTAYRVDVPLGTSIMRGAVNKKMPASTPTAAASGPARPATSTSTPLGSTRPACLSQAAGSRHAGLRCGGTAGLVPLPPDHDARGPAGLAERMPEEQHEASEVWRKGGLDDAIINFDAREDASSSDSTRSMSASRAHQDDIYEPISSPRRDYRETSARTATSALIGP